MGIPLNAVNVLVISSVTLFLSFISLIFRLWSRILKNTTLALNDYAIIVAFLFALGLVLAFYVASFAASLGIHTVQVPSETLVLHLKILWAAANFFVKISILHLYTEIFPNIYVRRVCYGIGALSGGYIISVIAEAFFMCHPIAYNWNKAIPNGHCDDQGAAYLGAGVINLLIDVSVVVLPMPLLWALQMDWKKKIGVAAMFSLGFLLMIAIWSVLEPTLGVVNACLPVMQPVLQKIFRRNTPRRSTVHSNDEQFFTVDGGRGVIYSKNRKFRKLRGVELPMDSLNTDEDLLAV
ncbi:hypothetical protein BOTCAL_0668g00020 [Botryotinia calthae]|uniref:Rhodopsin domain-containing protein n=1 Tax=Botryotinia calthae TaxID=38488 RepID=A0A4Y8CIF0_9HELO|nr:hypothetical protein BOTCAL_0668g00020 [Botryotinia calthae]